MGMGITKTLILLLNLGVLHLSLACPICPKLPPPHSAPKPPKQPPHSRKTPPSHVPKPPTVKPPKHPKPPPAVHPPPHVPKPPAVHPPEPPPFVPQPPVVTPPVNPITPPPQTPCPPPPQTCPTLKLDACVDILGGLVHVGIGTKTKDACCPVLGGLVDLDAALCLCTTIKAKLLNINIIIPIALQLLVECGKTPPSGFQCLA